jgi:predicted Zn-dependent protease
VCDYQLVIENSGDVNAYADGDRILVTRGMMRFAAEDQELALVIGHELGHNTMGHQSKKTTNAMLGLAADLLAAAAKVNTQGAFSKMGAQAYSQDIEREADYVGMYYLARSGYPIDGAAAFWRRMATEYPSTIRTSHSASHPATSERYLALDRTAVEIRGKDQSGLPLNPNKSN